MVLLEDGSANGTGQRITRARGSALKNKLGTSSRVVTDAGYPMGYPMQVREPHARERGFDNAPYGCAS